MPNKNTATQSISPTSSDHDILITLVANVQNNHAIMLDKVANLQMDMSDVKTGTNATLLDHETRLRLTERKIDEAHIEQLEQIVKENSQWINDHRVRTKFLWGVAAAIGAVVGTGVTLASFALHLLGK